MRRTALRVDGGGLCEGAQEPRAKTVARVRGAMAKRSSRVFGSSSRTLFCLPPLLSELWYSFVLCALAEPFLFNVGPPLPLSLSLAASSLFKTDFSEGNPPIQQIRRERESEDYFRRRILLVVVGIHSLFNVPSQPSHKQLKTTGTTGCT